MTQTLHIDPDKNFTKQWLLICAIGSAIGGAIGVLGGGGTGYFVGYHLGVSLPIPPEMGQSMIDFLASLFMGLASGGITSFFQWTLLRKFLSNAKWWILAGALGSSIGSAIHNVINSVLFRSDGNLDAVRLLSLFCVSLAITVPLIGLFKGFLEWLVLRKNFQSSTRWVSVRVITHIIVVLIGLIEFSIRTSLNLPVSSSFLTLLVAGSIEGVIFGAITGNILDSLIKEKSGTPFTRVQLERT